MNIIVTGSSGFIGKHLVKSLTDSSNTILEVDKKNGADLNDPRTFIWMSKLMPSPDIVVNLAGTCSTLRSFSNPREAFNDNTQAILNLLEYCRGNGAKLIHTSSAKASLGDQNLYTPYGLTKFFGEMLVFEWAKSYGLQVVVNRPGTIYGPGQHGSEESGWIGWFIKAALEGKPVIINGDGSIVRDILYIDDYVALLVDQVNNFKKYSNGTYRYYDVGGGKLNAIKIAEAVHFIHDLTGLEFSYGSPRKGDQKKIIADNTPIGRRNNWKPEVQWKDGIKQTIEYYKRGTL